MKSSISKEVLLAASSYAAARTALLAVSRLCNEWQTAVLVVSIAAACLLLQHDAYWLQLQGLMCVCS